MTTDSAGPADSPLALRYSAVSDVGRHRKDNQDSGYAGDHLLVVADGVGGAAYGDVASSTTVQILRRLDAAPSEELLPALVESVRLVHQRLAELADQDPELDGTSTTVTAALFDGRRIGVAHVGDSRAYLLRQSRLQQLTKDHTFVQTLVDEGQITEEAARIHPNRNIILRALDGIHEPDPDLFHVELEAGDRLLFCSDGCSGALTDLELAALLDEGTVDSAAVSLVQAALEGGSTDNVTVVVAEVVPASEAPDPDAAATAVGPLLVGAAAAQPRKGGVLGRTLFRGRLHDTGEIDPVPAHDSLDPEELRYAPQPPRRFETGRRLAWVVIPALVVAGALYAVYAWTQDQYFVGERDGYVVIYQGVQQDLPGLNLASLEENTGIKLTELAEVDQQTVSDGIEADSLRKAQLIVASLDRTEPCPLPSPSPSQSAGQSPTLTPAATPAPTPTPGATPSATGLNASPSPTPTATPTTDSCLDSTAVQP